MIRILLFGDFWNRQPLAYAPIRDRLADRIVFVEDAADAQIALFSHSHDLTRHGRALSRLVALHPDLRPVLLSEEPFWDSCWSADPFASYRMAQDGLVRFGYAVVNHFTSDVFDTERIPYFLLTDPRYVAQLSPLFDRNAGLGVDDWVRRWQAPQWDAVFMAERRQGPRHAPVFADREVWGLSVLRSRIARTCEGASILRAGKGWEDEPGRGELDDWHLDKLTRLAGTCRYVSAIENTHQANYVTEKIFDAFAVGAVPLYIATRSHRVGRYVGSDAWVNLRDRLPLEGAAFQPFDAGAAVGADLAGGYTVVQAQLARLFADGAVVEDELDLLADRLFEALQRLTL
ncbi:MAG: glycosyltransferase family 10 [bacterium]